jgi:PAS domain S-box-containing protein
VFQYRADEVIGRNVKMLMPDVDRDHHDQHMAEYCAGGSVGMIDKTRELVARRKDGRLFPVELCVTRVKVHDRDIFIGALRDISVRREVESRIRELARFPDENPSPVMRVGADGVITYANRPAAILLRVWETEVNSDVPPKILQVVRDALAAAAPTECEITCFERIYHLAFMPVPEGNYVNVLGDDITDRKHADQELKEHRDNLEELVSVRTTALVMAHNDALVASRAKSAFLASMSHELRTPLNAIIGYSEMLEENALEDGNESLQADLLKIKSSGRHLLMLINDILDLSKIEAGKVQFSLEEFGVEQLLRDLEATINPILKKNNNRFDVVVDGEVGTMYSDEMRVKQVLLNLLSNACKFTSHGRITLMVRRETTAAGAGLSFIINDTGIGMTNEQVHRLFEPFTQADRVIAIKYGGTGLGLAISRRLCQLMGGEIRVHSSIGVGTNFTVRLPAETVAQVEAIATPDVSS